MADRSLSQVHDFRLFDGDWYLAQNPDVAATGLDPLDHYQMYGAAEGRNPHPLFNTAWYLAQNPDVAAVGLNPLEHYLAHGAAEGRDPHPLFNTAWYLASNVDVAAAGLNPLEHYLTQGAAEGRDPHPLFETVWYLATYAGALARTGLDPLSHYLSEDGRNLGSNPNRYFDRTWYLSIYRDVLEAGKDPLIDYAQSGEAEGRDPGPLFQTAFYAAAHPDVIEAGINPLVHFLHTGEAEGREPRAPGWAATPVHKAVSSYEGWLSRHRVTVPRATLQRRLCANFATKPVISLIIPVYKVNAVVFATLIESVVVQSYPYWEMCIAVAYFDDPELLKTIDRAAATESRIKVRRLTENGGISRNSNEAFELATGTFIALLDHDDALPQDALYEVAKTIQQDDGDIFYSDKDAISEDGFRHFNPLFKAAWSPETMLGVNYITHLNVIRRSFVEQIGGWDPATDGAQDWDLFLRVVAAGARVRHIPKVLYHWRHVDTSVATRGLAAKPYAALGQLAAVRGWLHSQGWSTAEPVFMPEGDIRVVWSEGWKPAVTVVLFGTGAHLAEWRRRLDRDRLGAATEVRHGGRSLADVSRAIASANGDIVVVTPAAMSPMTADWLTELVGPLENDDIAAVSGKVLDPNGRILDAGWIFDEKIWQPIFRGAEANAYSVFGSVHWPRNFGAVSLNGTAFRKAAFIKADGLCAGARPDLDFSLRLRSRGGAPQNGRLFYNPFAASALNPDQSFERWWDGFAGEGIRPTQLVPAISVEPDPYFNINLMLGENGVPMIRPVPAPVRASSHNYEAEAGYFGGTLDAGRDIDARPYADVPREVGPLRIAWIVPNFTMPFYGGVMTILRCADYLRQRGVVPVFLGQDTASADVLRASIALAFPELAAAAEIHCVRADEDVDLLNIAPLDGAICTLWTTAFILRQMSRVRKKFYFVQDYEPLFYPAGTTSSLVESTYRFGFFGICNTEPVCDHYKVFGAEADFFNPAVDTDVFHARGRIVKGPNDPVTIFSYARPGHPRNCFELLAPALVEVKRRFGKGVQIFTAGSDWYPADYGLADTVEHLGVMPYAATGDLYRACDVGVVAMATCHPSYLPFELMATGAVVCTNVNRHTKWLLRHQENCYLFELAKTSIANALGTVILDSNLRQEITLKGFDTIQKGYCNWNASCARVHSILLKKIEC